jgi:hypothetical protein
VAGEPAANEVNRDATLLGSGRKDH